MTVRFGKRLAMASALRRKAPQQTSSVRFGPDVVGQGLQLLGTQRLRGDVDEVGLGAVAVLPVHIGAGREGEAFQLGHRRGQHLGVVFLVDHPLAEAVLLQQAGRQAVVAEAAAALPAGGLGDAAGIFAVDDLLQARNDVGVAVLAQLDHDPAAAHLVGDGAGGAGASKGVEDKIAGIGRDVQNALEQALWLWRREDVISTKDPRDLLLCLVVVADLLVQPNRVSAQARRASERNRFRNGNVRRRSCPTRFGCRAPVRRTVSFENAPPPIGPGGDSTSPMRARRPRTCHPPYGFAVPLDRDCRQAPRGSLSGFLKSASLCFVVRTTWLRFHFAISRAYTST